MRPAHGLGNVPVIVWTDRYFWLQVEQHSWIGGAIREQINYGQRVVAEAPREAYTASDSGIILCGVSRARIEHDEADGMAHCW